jgi:hypothetical protein
LATSFRTVYGIAEDRRTSRDVKNGTGPFLQSNYRLTDALTHIVSTRALSHISSIIYALFPELKIPLLPSEPSPHPRTKGLDFAQRKASRRDAAVRGCTYGPYVFSALLNGLEKSGKTHLAYQVWQLALRSEKRSWSTAEPWTLTVACYTSFFRCLEQDLRTRGSKCKIEEKRILDSAWKTYLAMRAKGSVVKAYMNEQGLISEDNLEKWNKVWEWLPRPDARLFNCLLDIFILPQIKSSSCTSTDKPRPPSPADLQAQFDALRKQFIETGRRPPVYTPYIKALARDMVRAGFPVPPAYRHLFIGRWEPGMMGDWKGDEREVLPYIAEQEQRVERKEPFMAYRLKVSYTKAVVRQMRRRKAD